MAFREWKAIGSDLVFRLIPLYALMNPLRNGTMRTRRKVEWIISIKWQWAWHNASRIDARWQLGKFTSTQKLGYRWGYTRAYSIEILFHHLLFICWVFQHHWWISHYRSHFPGEPTIKQLLRQLLNNSIAKWCSVLMFWKGELGNEASEQNAGARFARPVTLNLAARLLNFNIQQPLFNYTRSFLNASTPHTSLYAWFLLSLSATTFWHVMNFLTSST